MKLIALLSLVIIAPTAQAADTCGDYNHNSAYTHNCYCGKDAKGAEVSVNGCGLWSARYRAMKLSVCRTNGFTCKLIGS